MDGRPGDRRYPQALSHLSSFKEGKEIKEKKRMKQ